MIPTFKVTALLLLLVVACAGCAGNDASRFYLLTPDTRAVPLSENPGLPSGIAITAVRLPEYLNRSQIVTRLSENEVQVGWFDRWAEPLERNLSRVLAQNLEKLLSFPCSPALSLPAGAAVSTISYRVDVEVTRMDGSLGKEVSLDAWWSVAEGGKKGLASRKSSFKQPVRNAGYEAFVEAQSRAVFDLSREIALTIADLQGKAKER